MRALRAAGYDLDCSGLTRMASRLVWALTLLHLKSTRRCGQGGEGVCAATVFWPLHKLWSARGVDKEENDGGPLLLLSCCSMAGNDGPGALRAYAGPNGARARNAAPTYVEAIYGRRLDLDEP